MALLKPIFRSSKDEIWRQLSEEIGGEFIEGKTWKGGKVVAKVDDWTVTLDTYIFHTQHDQHVYTRLRAPYVNKDGFRFEVYHEGLISKIEKMLGMQDIQIGYPEFDNHYIIQSNDEAKVKALFFSKRIRRLIEPHPNIHLMIKDDEGWFHDSFPEGVDELYCLIDGEITDLDQLSHLFELFAEVLNHLCHLGSAYENDPEIELG